MKTLEQVKESYAKNIGYNHWVDLLNDDNLELSEIYDHYDQVALELAIQFNPFSYNEKQKTQLEKWNDLQQAKPNEIGFYLCFLVEVNDLGVSKYQDLKFWDEKSFNDVSVKYWMPLPKPPEK